jgi:hypothetical protein
LRAYVDGANTHSLKVPSERGRLPRSPQHRPGLIDPHGPGGIPRALGGRRRIPRSIWPAVEAAASQRQSSAELVGLHVGTTH